MKVIDYKPGLASNNNLNQNQGYNISQYSSNKNSFNQNQGINNSNKIMPSNNFSKPNVIIYKYYR